MTESLGKKSRYLVVHDYGMGGCWWWVRASSAAQIVETCAEVEVMTDAASLARADGWALEEVDIDALAPGSALANLRDQRDRYRDRPGYKALVGRDRVYLRMPDEYGGDVAYLVEIGPDGRWLRQVTVAGDGSAVRTTSEHWPINAPLDLYDPEYAAMEIDEAGFHAAWSRALPDPDDPV